MGLAAVAVMTNCGPKKQKASDAAKLAVEHLRDGRYADFIEVVDLDTLVVDEDSIVGRQGYADVLKSNVHRKIQDKGGIKDVAVVSEMPSSDGAISDVKLRNTYNNGDVEEVDLVMVCMPDNVWKVKMGNDKEVWTTTYADGTKETVKLKSDARRDIYKDNVDGERNYLKIKEKGDEEVVKTKIDGEKVVTRTPD